MTGYLTTAQQITALGPAYQRVLITADTMQLVALTLDPGQETGLVTHTEADQLVVFLTGWPIEVTVSGEHHQVSAGTVLLVPKRRAPVRQQRQPASHNPQRLRTARAARGQGD